MGFSVACDPTTHISQCVVNACPNLTSPCRQAVKAKPSRKVYVHMVTLNWGQAGCLALQKAEHLQNIKADYIKNVIHIQAAPQLTVQILGPDIKSLQGMWVLHRDAAILYMSNHCSPKTWQLLYQKCCGLSMYLEFRFPVENSTHSFLFN